MKNAAMLTKGMAVLTAASVLFCLPSASVRADEPQYDSTKAFIEVLNDEGIEYTYDGMTDSGSEMLNVISPGDYFEQLDFEFCFKEDSELFTIYVWDLYTPNVDTSVNRATVYETMNDFNSNYRFVTFYLDTDDTISASVSGTTVGVLDIGENVYDLYQWLKYTVNDEDVYNAIIEL